jgi:hypothetical protein
MSINMSLHQPKVHEIDRLLGIVADYSWQLDMRPPSTAGVDAPFETSLGSLLDQTITLLNSKVNALTIHLASDKSSH